MLGVGVVGLGFGLSAHANAWNCDPRAKVVAVCGRNQQRAEQLGRQHRLSAWTLEEMLESKEVSVLSIAVPPQEQSQIICRAAAAGKHVFCEKPLAANLEQAKTAVESATKAGIVHGIDLFFPEIPAWVEAKCALADLGELRHAHLSWLLQSRAFQHGLGGWKVDSTLGGGTLANFAAHSFHYLEWLFGPLGAVCGHPTGGSSKHSQAGAHLVLTFQSGLTAGVAIAADAPTGSGHRLEVYGSRGCLVLKNNSGDFARGFSLDVAVDGEPLRQRFAPEDGSGDGRVPHVRSLASRFVDCVENKTPMHPGLHEGLRVQELLQASSEALDQGRWVHLP